MNAEVDIRGSRYPSYGDVDMCEGESTRCDARIKPWEDALGACAKDPHAYAWV